MNRTHYAVAVGASLSSLFSVATRRMVSVLPSAFAVLCTALVSVVSAGVASAQSCYTVRDAQGKVVYQSVKAPVDVTVPFKDEIETRFPGGYMQIDTNFFRCGSYERPAVVEAHATYATAKQKGLFDEMPPFVPAPSQPQGTQQANNEKTADATPNLFEHLIPKPAAGTVPVYGQVPTQTTVAPTSQAQPDTQSPSGGSFGSIMPKILAAGLIVGILCLPKTARKVTLSVVAGIFILAIAFAAYESARPPKLPFAQCIIDNVPFVRNDVAAYAAASRCVELHGGYNSVAAKRYVKGQAVGFMTPKSRAECVTRHASNTESETAAKLVYGACNCLYQSVSEGASETSFTCG